MELFYSIFCMGFKTEFNIAIWMNGAGPGIYIEYTIYVYKLSSNNKAKELKVFSLLVRKRLNFF